jgi:hypothetical protein
MHKVNTTKIVELTWSSPKGKFIGAGKEVSESFLMFGNNRIEIGLTMQPDCDEP